MIDLHYWTTPNGQKVLIFLEEAGMKYQLKIVDIRKGDQFAFDFLQISPNNRIPAIVDMSPQDGGAALSVFESGAILLYLSEKVGRFIAKDPRGRTEISKWLFWQMAGLGPMAGQTHHFRIYAPHKIDYAIDRYTKECARLYRVLNTCLSNREYIAGDEYTISDIATYPWVASHHRHGQSLEDFPNVKRWYEGIKSRHAVVKAYDLAQKINPEFVA